MMAGLEELALFGKGEEGEAPRGGEEWVEFGSEVGMRVGCWVRREPAKRKVSFEGREG